MDEPSIVDLASRVLSLTHQEASDWLNTANMWLDGKSPNELVSEGREQDVGDYLNRVDTVGYA